MYQVNHLKEIFSGLCSRYSGNGSLIDRLWKEIENAYSEPSRHYHTLHHLARLIDELSAVRDKIIDWDTILFSIFYHDFIYDVLQSNNEEKSAARAGECLEILGLNLHSIEKCRRQILATASHEPVADPDCQYFTDADLAILGSERTEYLTYINSIQKEYSAFPILIYREGRKNIIRKFLERDRIFQSEYFFEKYESTARGNLRYELFELLS